ncbi:HAD family hydrolase [Brevibacillus choshinensis]|uniref:HAD family hydrolase n=1 Tax=Brevibacillus choshinensis TaxID=54911 RepID=A0ABX7FRF3_BRECH|nr:HAD family hydrolase [Brevibacillus choshinensis]QRG68184.1 HAD family hydrolase [Brevibacillus choshinensis]
MTKKRWITFDLDGTLMQNPFGAWVFPEIAEAVSGRLGRQHDVVSEMVAEHEARMASGRYVEAYDWDDILRERLRKLDLADPFEIEPLVRKHSVPPKVWLLESGIREVLAELKAGGYSLAVVTNGFYKFQAPVMEALGLIELFDEVVTPERAGTGKPDPAILSGLSGQIIAHVGDRLDHDVQLANRSNIAALFIYRNLPADLKSLSPFMRMKDPLGIRLLSEKARKEERNAGWSELPSELLPAALVDSVHEIPALLDALKES